MLTKGSRTRQHIIATAAPIFNVKGFAGASIADVLEASGVEKGGLYRHFASKDELAVAAFDHAVKVLETRHGAAQAKSKSALARLGAFVDTVAGSIVEPPMRGGCPILNTAIEADDTHAELREHAAEAMRNWQARIVAAVEEGVATGELRTDADALMTASVLTSALEGAIMVAALLREPAHMVGVARHLHAFLDSLVSGHVRQRRVAT